MSLQKFQGVQTILSIRSSRSGPNATTVNVFGSNCVLPASRYMKDTDLNLPLHNTLCRTFLLLDRCYKRSLHQDRKERPSYTHFVSNFDISLEIIIPFFEYPLYFVLHDLLPPLQHDNIVHKPFPLSLEGLYEHIEPFLG